MYLKWAKYIQAQIIGTQLNIDACFPRHGTTDQNTGNYSFVLFFFFLYLNLT